MQEIQQEATKAETAFVVSYSVSCTMTVKMADYESSVSSRHGEQLTLPILFQRFQP